VKLSSRDKRLLPLLGAVLLTTIYVLSSSGPGVPAVVSPSKAMTIPEAELQLARMRQSVARVPGKDEILKQAAAELARREKGLIDADTANQAQEQVLLIVRKIASAQSPPVEIKSVELGAPRSFGDAYGEVVVAANFECHIEQLVQIMADLSARPELVAMSDLRMAAANPKQKTVNIRMTVSGIVPKKLAPDKKAGSL
jgi:Type II secretion system (T2SS), protein M subtype b